MTQAYFLNTITNILGFSAKQPEVLSDDRYDTISTIIHWKYSEICDWCKTNYKLKTTRGGASNGYRKIKCLQALAWWATDLTLRDKQIVLANIYSTFM